MDRSDLVAALQHASGAARTCSVAVAGGADFKIFEGTTASPDLARIYRRRAKHVRMAGYENDGFEEALAALDAWQPGQVRLGQVSDTIAKRHYQLFLAPDTDEVVGCLWVHHDAE